MANLNPQQQAFKEAYCNPNSPTFGNAKGSAKSVGYSEEYADTITGQGNEWLSGILRDREMLEDAEKALKEAVTYPTVGDDGKRDPAFAALKLKSATFIAERLGKDRYAQRSEHTGKDGRDLPTPIIALPKE